MRKFANLLIGISLFGMWSPASAVTIVSADNVAVSAGSTVVLPISITDVTDLFAFQFDLTFDGALARVNSIVEGSLLPAGGPTFFLPGTIDNTLGTVEFIANSFLGAIPGVTGNGVLANIQFQGLGAGSGTVAIANLTLLDSALNSISFSTIEGSITVQPGGAIPEPSTTALLGGGALCLSLLRWARSRSGGARPEIPTLGVVQ